MTAPIRYPIRTRILHWLTAALVFSALFIGFVMVNSLGSYASLRLVHMTLGVLILVIVVVAPPTGSPTACRNFPTLSAGWNTSSWWVPS